MTRSLIGVLAMAAALAGCASTQKWQCECCHEARVEPYSKPAAAIGGIDASPRKSGGTRQ